MNPKSSTSDIMTGPKIGARSIDIRFDTIFGPDSGVKVRRQTLRSPPPANQVALCASSAIRSGGLHEGRSSKAIVI